MLLLYPIIYPLAIKKERHPALFKAKLFWSKLLCLLTGAIFYVKGREKVPEGPFVIVANHQSYTDIVYMYRVIKTHYKFMAKAELSSWPLFGIFFKMKSDIAVHRRNKQLAGQALVEADQSIKEGISIAFFAEGTIPMNTPQLGAFKNGAFKIAIENQVPIVPITFLSNWRRMGEPMVFTSKGSPGLCRAVIHDAIPTKGLMMDEMTELREKTRDVIQKPLIERGYSSPKIKRDELEEWVKTKS
ncbi:MAG: lysophospholipid acyltransferase family protein [Bacteroidota bacterium]